MTLDKEKLIEKIEAQRQKREQEQAAARRRKKKMDSSGGGGGGLAGDDGEPANPLGRFKKRRVSARP